MPLRLQILAALIFTVEPATAQKSPVAQQAVWQWLACVNEVGMRYATGRDAADFIIRAALDACPKEYAAAFNLVIDETPKLPNMTFHEREFQRVVHHEQMRALGTKLLTGTIAEARAKQPKK
jgi:hypothetical protein